MAKRKSRKKIKNDRQAILLFLAALLLFGVLWALNELGVISYGGIAEKTGLSEPTRVVGEGTSVHFIDVGQGDCTLVMSGGKTLLIDAGEAEYGSDVCSYLKAQGVTRLDYIIATHPHSDHIGGLAKVISTYEVGTLITSRTPDDITPTGKSYMNFLNAVKENGCGLTEAVVGDSYSLGNAEFEIIAPLSDESDDLNNYSVVCMLTCEGGKILFTGDASKDEEKDILDNNSNIDADILKVGHHGSSSSSTKKFLAEVTPEFCVIMCGADNSYNHPNESTVKRLKEYTNEIYRTDLQGTIVCTADENGGWSFTFENGGQ